MTDYSGGERCRLCGGFTSGGGSIDGSDNVVWSRLVRGGGICDPVGNRRRKYSMTTVCPAVTISWTAVTMRISDS